MENRIEFTEEMRKTHTILIPNMLPVHFELIANVLVQHGYKIELLKNEGRAVVDAGLSYVHNDMCYPALLCIGQMIDALKSGKYDLDHTALMITQTGGGCRASNYIHLLRKALERANLGHIPVISLNVSGLEKNSGFSITVPMLAQAVYAIFYGDMLMLLNNQVRSREIHAGDSQRMLETWTRRIAEECRTPCFATRFQKNLRAMVRDFAAIPVTDEPRLKVGIVGEIYVKYSSLANNHLEDFLVSQGCEVVVPGLMGFIGLMIENHLEDARLYGKGGAVLVASKVAGWYVERIEKKMRRVLIESGRFAAPAPFKTLCRLVEGVIGRGCKMGEGWLLTAEMLELIDSGCSNIICAQPFGCLPNHIVGKGMIRTLSRLHPEANIVPIDYDPGASRVNQENRIKLMLAVAREREAKVHGASASEAEEAAVAAQ